VLDSAPEEDGLNSCWRKFLCSYGKQILRIRHYKIWKKYIFNGTICL